MIKYIDADLCKAYATDYYPSVAYGVRKIIDEQPTADVKPIVKGEWIEDGYNDEPCVCSNCGHPEPIKAMFLYSYCPYCGADMRKRRME